MGCAMYTARFRQMLHSPLLQVRGVYFDVATATDSDSFHRGFRSGGNSPTHSRADSHGMVAKERAVRFRLRLVPGRYDRRRRLAHASNACIVEYTIRIRVRGLAGTVDCLHGTVALEAL